VKRHYLAMLGVVLGALVSTESEASDDATYPGNVCRWLSGGSYQVFSSSIMNTSTSSTMKVVCPLGRDSKSTLIGADTRVFDRNPNADVKVQLFMEVSSGSQLLFASDTRFSSSSGANVQKLTHGVLENNSIHATYFAVCDVPPAVNGQVSHINSFLLFEVGSD